jgi:hypothetical protein
MKTNITTTCVPRNGGSDCVGAGASSAGTFMNNWRSKRILKRVAYLTADGRNLVLTQVTVDETTMPIFVCCSV